MFLGVGQVTWRNIFWRSPFRRWSILALLFFRTQLLSQSCVPKSRIGLLDAGPFLEIVVKDLHRVQTPNKGNSVNLNDTGGGLSKTEETFPAVFMPFSKFVLLDRMWREFAGCRLPWRSGGQVNSLRFLNFDVLFCIRTVHWLVIITTRTITPPLLAESD